MCVHGPVTEFVCVCVRTHSAHEGVKFVCAFAPEHGLLSVAMLHDSTVLIITLHNSQFDAYTHKKSGVCTRGLDQ